MKFKTDENLPIEIASLLRSAGHDATSVVEQQLQGEVDPKIADICRIEERILLTLDLNFADVRTYPPWEYSGIVVLRVRRHDRPYLIAAIQRLLPIFETEQIEQRLWIVDEY